MISAWDIYWVMQLDCISSTVQWFAWMGLIVAAVCGAVYGITEGDAAWASGRAKQAVVVSVVAATLSAFIPSTKSAAMMIVVPRIANNEAIQREAGDLYGIAKDALRNLATPKQEAK